ncbi:uncharacterized protein LOC129625250 [Bubalus kerabau]|uniref:uncharacterized protein LOC129625250 n=1 Tax=Bubalus carabanensis TaxID=3119969 RepID=UPI00244E97A7|nr:uncharacterized protein LOC129625250 [Bubalus carabanensis]
MEAVLPGEPETQGSGAVTGAGEPSPYSLAGSSLLPGRGLNTGPQQRKGGLSEERKPLEILSVNLSLCCRNATPTGAKCGCPGLGGRLVVVSLAPFQHLSCTEHHGEQCPDDGIRGHRRDSGAPDWRTSLHVGQERLRGQRASSAPPPTPGDGWQRQGMRSQLQPVPQRPLCPQHHLSGARPALSLSTSVRFTQTQEPEIIPILQMNGETSSGRREITCSHTLGQESVSWEVRPGWGF